MSRDGPTAQHDCHVGGALERWRPMTPPLVRDDCVHFNGYKPCRPHKETQVHCDDCTRYQPARFRILVLKVGLAGEVLRCTPLLRRLRELHPDADITWVTAFPDFVPAPVVRAFSPLERLLERSAARVYSAHYMAAIRKS